MNLHLRQFPPSRLGKLILPDFVMGKHLRPVEELVLDMYEDQFDNLSIQLPIRHSKSTYAACVALRLLLANPDERIIIAAYSTTAAEEILRPVRDALLAWGPKLNKVAIDPDACRADYFKIYGRRGECRAVSIGTKFSHATANTIICDDILTEESAASPVQRKAAEDWFFSTLMNRRTKSPRGRPKLICTMTPRHPDDVLNKIENANANANDSNRWVIHRQPCLIDSVPIFPELWPLTMLLDKKKELEDHGKGHVWETVWMCNPQLGASISFLADWLPHYGEKPKLPHIDLWYDATARPWIYANTTLKVVCADCSISGYGDYTSIQTVHVVQHSDNSYHLYLDRHFRKQCVIPDARAALTEILLRDRPDVASCEATGFQRLVLLDANDETAKHGFLARLRPFDPPQAMHKEDDIALRLGDILAEGRLHLFHCPENVELRGELIALPHGDNDDSADCLRQCVHLVNSVLFA